MTTPENQAAPTLEQQPFVTHLLELRDRLLRIVIAAFAVFILLFPFANDLYTILANPLIKHLPEGTGMIATKVIAPFLTPLKLTFMMAIFLTVPYILHQFWSFVAPGLYRHEKRLAMPLVVSSAILFYLGMSFAYFVVFPLLFDILPSMAPEQITVSPDITDYLDFVLTLFFAFGIAFEVPIATIILVWMGVTTPDSLAAKRPYLVIGAFCVGMLLTPPDVISQTLLALPMWILFEIGLICSRAFVRDRDDEPVQPAAPERFDDGDDFSDLGTPKPAERPPAAPDDAASPPTPGEVQAKLRLVSDYRDEADNERARALLYEVLAEGNEDQIRAARILLQQLDDEN
ncbi:Twin-arginine translocation protein TatC [hydrothermal vent metagenome]|uniref:Twin-arginine translocation protein TatC n=1 Tax=hydrothermal vent metagenome TaxID=652676 RepID=A0A3B1ASG0_9ZZZZ